MTEPQHDDWIEMLGVIAHDLRGPITAIKGFIELVQHAGPLNEKQQRYADRALGSLDHMQQLVGMLLDIAWLDADKPLELGTCDVGDLIDESVVMHEMAASKRNVKLHVDLSPNLGTILGDLQRLQQAIHNLVSNAIKYNREDGEIWIVARGERDQIEVSVRDSGYGIPPEELPLLFDPFYRANTNNAARIEGTGLGLAIVKAVIEKHQGKVWVDSVPDKGSTFTFTLPRRPLAGTLPDVTEELPAARGTTEHLNGTGMGPVTPDTPTNPTSGE